MLKMLLLALLIAALSHVVMFNIFAWSWGLCLISGDKSKITVNKMLFSPGIIGVVIGMLLFVASVPLPNALKTALTHISNLNTPLLRTSHRFDSGQGCQKTM
ncbi:MAG: hypothetical protein J6A61_03350 [Clostridia bacterium]|nr:hypothetical protein [Clostridia bacterium]